MECLNFATNLHVGKGREGRKGEMEGQGRHINYLSFMSLHLTLLLSSSSPYLCSPHPSTLSLSSSSSSSIILLNFTSHIRPLRSVFPSLLPLLFPLFLAFLLHALPVSHLRLYFILSLPAFFIPFIPHSSQPDLSLLHFIPCSPHLPSLAHLSFLFLSSMISPPRSCLFYSSFYSLFLSPFLSFVPPHHSLISSPLLSLHCIHSTLLLSFLFCLFIPFSLHPCLPSFAGSSLFLFTLAPSAPILCTLSTCQCYEGMFTPLTVSA